MTIGEHVAGTVQVYDYQNHDWSTIASLSDANIISCKTKRLCCATGAFEIGGVYAATLSMVCRLPGISRYQIRGCRILLRRWYDGESYTASTAPLEGIFWVTDAQKKAEIFTLSGQDAMGWADTSSYNHNAEEVVQDGTLSAGVYGFGEFLAQLYSDGPVLQAWMDRCVNLANILAMNQMGLRKRLLVWRDYDKTQNGGIEYCNNYLWTDHNVEDTTQNACFFLYQDDGVYKDDNPRSFLRWLAQAAGGFITVTKDGYLTLRQFVQPSLGDAVVYMADMELDSCEVADYRLQLYSTTVVYDDFQPAWAAGDVPNANGLSPYRIYVEGNPFMNGYQKRMDNEWLSPVWGLAMSMYHYGENRNCIARPFRVKVHTTDRYELGERICFPDWHDLGEVAGVSVYRDTNAAVYRDQNGQIYRLRGGEPLYSVITSIEWTFRGGTVLSCGGEDTRVMADCIKASKADRAIREMRSRFKATE